MRYFQLKGKLVIIGALTSTRITRAIITFFIGLSFIMLSGCGAMQAYDGPKLQPSEVAIIRPYRPFTGFGYVDKGAHPISINKIDGKDLEFKDRCEILPGTHKVSINMPKNYGGYIEGGPEKGISFDAEAGHVYTVYGRRLPKSVAVWIVDDTTNKLVAKEGE